MNHHEAKASRSKPPYLLGLLGFIPLVGFFVGIGLVLHGTRVYKDKKLILIGSACMLFSITIYTSLYIFSRSAFMDEAWKEHAQMQLNSLVKSVEFYKLENGVYPDNLKQLEKTGDLVFTVDPTQLEKNSEKPGYNYQNLGNRYLLFSSGIDGIPNTNDDIYPIVNPHGKTGWTKVK